MMKFDKMKKKQSTLKGFSIKETNSFLLLPTPKKCQKIYIFICLLLIAKLTFTYTVVITVAPKLRNLTLLFLNASF